jgi:predicted alpha/beta hydrolase family esterase
LFVFSEAMRRLILPGWANSGPAHWQSLWEKTVPNCKRVQQEDWREPGLEKWLASLHEEVLSAKEPIVFVCHSLGCWLVHWCQQHPELAKSIVKGALLVAPPDLNRTNVELWPGMFSWLPFPQETILPFQSVMIYSSNDEYCCEEEALKMSRMLGCSRVVCAGPLGHINAQSEIGEWEQGKEHLFTIV